MYKYATPLIILLIATSVLAQEASEEAPVAPKEKAAETTVEQAKKNATEFLATLKGVNKSILSKTRYRLKLRGRQIGSVDFEIKKAKWGDEDCYQLSTTMAFAVGRVDTKMISNGYYTGGLKLLSNTKIEYDGDELSESSCTVYADGKYMKSWVDDDGEVETAAFDWQPRQILGDADMLLPLLLPRTKLVKYSFSVWSSDFKDHEETYEVFGKKTVGELEGYSIVQKELYLKDDGKGQERPEIRTVDILVSEDGKTLRAKASDVPVIFELDDGRFEKAEIIKLATPLAPVLCFWVGLRDKDAELFKSAFNEDKYLRDIFVNDPDYKDYTEAQMDALVKEVKKTYAKETVKDGLEEDMTALMGGISTSWFKVKLDGENKATVSLSKEFAETTGDESEMSWDIEKDEETGTWKITKMLTDDDDF